MRPTVASINLSASTGRAGLKVGDRVRITGTGLYSGDLATIEKLATGPIPSAVVRTEAGRTRQVRTIDLEPVATVCKAEGLALIVDSTFASPVNFRPLEHGADLVIHSATKYLNGHTDVIAGAVAGTDQVVEEVRRLMQVWGQAIDPFAAVTKITPPRSPRRLS